MNKLLTICLLAISSISYAQTGVVDKYHTAIDLIQSQQYTQAANVLNEIEAKCDPKDTLYKYILWAHTNSLSQIEKQFRDNERFDSSLYYAQLALKQINKSKPFFDDKFATREMWMNKNIVVAYFGLGQLDKAKQYRDILYKASKEKKLPEGMDEYFNFSFFKWEGKNVWGYEWFEELPEDRGSKSFTKILYYVYSTNPDGTDKDQLYRLHVLMFHKFDNSVKFDYVLTKELATATADVSGTLYAYTYNEKIDYKKLDTDIREVLKGNYEGDTKSTIKKSKH